MCPSAVEKSCDEVCNAFGKTTFNVVQDADKNVIARKSTSIIFDFILLPFIFLRLDCPV